MADDFSWTNITSGGQYDKLFKSFLATILYNDLNVYINFFSFYSYCNYYAVK